MDEYSFNVECYSTETVGQDILFSTMFNNIVLKNLKNKEQNDETVKLKNAGPRVHKEHCTNSYMSNNAFQDTEPVYPRI